MAAGSTLEKTSSNFGGQRYEFHCRGLFFHTLLGGMLVPSWKTAPSPVNSHIGDTLWCLTSRTSVSGLRTVLAGLSLRCIRFRLLIPYNEVNVCKPRKCLASISISIALKKRSVIAIPSGEMHMAIIKRICFREV